MSSVLPFDIIDQIIDKVEENKDTDLLKKLALVSHSFLQICRKHLFATVDLHDAVSSRHLASSKKGFIKLLKSKPDVVEYIRKLRYRVENTRWEYNTPFPHLQFSSTYPRLDNDDYLLSPILPNLLRTIPRLNCFTIIGSKSDWNTLDSSLTSAFLHLMHLPTINHIHILFIQNFPLSSLAESVNLHRLDIFHLGRSNPSEEDVYPEIVVQSEMPKIREFRTSGSALLIEKLLHAKWQDGRPAFNFMDLRRLSISFENEQNIRYLLPKAKLLEKLQLLYGSERSLVGLHNMLFPSARTLKVLNFIVSIYPVPLALAGLCMELEAMAGHYVLEALSFLVKVDGHETEDFIGSTIQEVEKVLVKPGWSGLRQVSFKVSIACCLVTRVKITDLFEALQSLPDKYLSHLSKLESVAFNYSAYRECAFRHGID